MDVVVAPRVLLDAGGRLRLNVQYYITKQINAALGRVLQLVGVDVNSWRAHLPLPLPGLRRAAAGRVTGLMTPFLSGGSGPTDWRSSGLADVRLHVREQNLGRRQGPEETRAGVGAQVCDDGAAAEEAAAEAAAAAARPKKRWHHRPFLPL